jgi:hypothetical protein
MKWLYYCSGCGSCFLDGRRSLPRWCLCGATYVVYELPWSLCVCELADVLAALRAGGLTAIV